jgi:hypothetical protein
MIYSKVNFLTKKETEKEENISNYSINLGELGIEDSSRNLQTIDPINLKFTNKYIFNKQLHNKFIDTNIFLDLGEIYKNISKIITKKSKLFESSGIDILTSNFRKIDREIDSPNNKESKGLVSYNKRLFKKLLIFLKLIFNKEIELDLTRIKNPYNEIHILNQILGEAIKYKTKTNTFHKLTQIISENANIKSNFISELDTTADKNKISYLSSILAESMYTSNNIALNNNKKNILFEDYEYNIIQGQSIYYPFYLPISFSRKNEFRNSNNIANLQMKVLHSSNRKRDIVRDIEIERKEDREKDIKKHISYYNYIALEKWSNLNQINKQEKVHKLIELDLNNIELNNQLLNERDSEMDKLRENNIDKKIEQDANKERYTYKNILDTDKPRPLINDTREQAQENNYIN